MDLFRAYASLLGTVEGRKRSRAPDPELLRHRGSSGLTRREKLRILTYLGSPFGGLRLPRDQGRGVLGGAVLERAEMLGPVRPRTYGSFDVFEYCDKMWITLHCGPRPMSRLRADDLSAAYLRFLRASIQGRE